MNPITVEKEVYDGLRITAAHNAQALTDEHTAHTTTKKQLTDYKHRVDEARQALASEQKEHGITAMQRDTLQTQCEDMQSEMEAESKINNASLKPSCKVLQQDQDDEMACMAEEVVGLKMELKRAHQRTYESVVNEGNLKEEINTLKDSAETQGRHMQQVDAACKVAEERVMAQRAIIDKMKKDNDVYICPSAHGCTKTHCPDKSPHKHNRDCDIVCKIASSGCVKVNSCKECATMREEIINRDAVILQYESRAEDREEIITSLAKEIKGMRCVEVTAPTTGTYTIMFSGKAGEMKKTAQQRRCKYYKHCVYATSSSNVCDNGGGKYCGVWRHHEAKQ